MADGGWTAMDGGWAVVLGAPYRHKNKKDGVTKEPLSPFLRLGTLTLTTWLPPTMTNMDLIDLPSAT